MLLGAKQFFERSGKSVPTARDYVQNGLVAMWDGIENAGWGVHDSAATTWKDLVGARDLPTNNISFLDNCAVFSGNAIAESSSVFGMDFVEAVFNTASGGIIVATNSTTGNRLWASGEYIARNFYYSESAIKYQWSNKTISVSANKIQGGISQAYVNGTAATIENNISSAYGGLSINGTMMGAASFSGKIFCVRLYNRTLTSTEVAANYAVDKERFNLP